jgi:bifunctional non-homologous end joining protein LigD
MLYVEDVLRVRTRSGRDITALVPELHGIADLIPNGTILDGEPVAGQGRPGDFYRLGPGLSARNRRMPVSFVAFDVLATHGELVTGQPYRERRRMLEDMQFEGPAWCTASSFEGDADAFRACIEAGLEGLVLKRLDSRYEPGKRSRGWVKVKTSGWKIDHAPALHE